VIFLISLPCIRCATEPGEHASPPPLTLRWTGRGDADSAALLDREDVVRRWSGRCVVGRSTSPNPIDADAIPARAKKEEMRQLFGRARARLVAGQQHGYDDAARAP
jgi:hypothetical protein